MKSALLVSVHLICIVSNSIFAILYFAGGDWFWGAISLIVVILLSICSVINYRKPKLPPWIEEESWINWKD